MTAQQKTKIIYAIPALLLGAAFLGNLFIEGFNWSFVDFMGAGLLLFGTAFLITMIVNSKRSLQNKILISGIIILILVLVWMELAVGIFGSPFAGS
ncbi:hypothetical protein HNP38_003562 [Chryseobacterium defluvii]|uniref:LIVCS family branched-chain amino acid:cation transporter n=1 Tax=Chryseobacterium defluvii TaxID=160396 RepID=A0A840KFV0_9FLAO|nr:hypothetical protein [Chryseobacterium defluvii]MBB4808221.1 hypothetical protein [Chryseobacterium defluvii]